MKREKPKSDSEDRFRHKDHEVVIRSHDERTEIVIDGNVHKVRFLQNGRPYTSAFVSVMAKSVRDLAERFVDTSVAQRAHWDEIVAARAKGDDCD